MVRVGVPEFAAPKTSIKPTPVKTHCVLPQEAAAYVKLGYKFGP